MSFRFRRLVVVLASAGVLAVVSRYLVANSGPSFEAVLESSDEIILYEGLPHQGSESRLYEREKKSKSVQTLDKHFFYKQPLQLRTGDGASIVELLKSPDTFKPYSQSKKCGGYHPDYALEFQKGRWRYHVFLCFGCGEARIVGARKPSKYNLRLKAFDRLEEILLPYRQNRPPHQFDVDIQ